MRSSFGATRSCGGSRPCFFCWCGYSRECWPRAALSISPFSFCRRSSTSLPPLHGGSLGCSRSGRCVSRITWYRYTSRCSMRASVTFAANASWYGIRRYGDVLNESADAGHERRPPAADVFVHADARNQKPVLVGPVPTLPGGDCARVVRADDLYGCRGRIAVRIAEQIDGSSQPVGDLGARNT